MSRPLTRKQRKDTIDAVAGGVAAAADAAAVALVDALSDSEEGDLATPKKALRGKYGAVLKKIYDEMVKMVHDSALPLFREHFSKAAMSDFIHYLIDVKEANEASLEEDDDDDDDDDDSFEGDEEEDEEEEEEESEVEEEEQEEKKQQ